MRFVLSLIVIYALIDLSGVQVFAQGNKKGQAEAKNANSAVDAAQDAGPVYEPKEVDKKAIIFRKLEPSYTEAAQREQVEGVVYLSAVLSADGKVVDIKIIKGLPHGLTEKAVSAAKDIEFTPAEKDGRQVAIRVKLAYYFILPGNSYYGDSSKKMYYKSGCADYHRIGPNDFVVFKNEKEAKESGYRIADCP